MRVLMLLNDFDDFTEDDFPLLFSHNKDTGKKKGNVIAKLLQSVNQKKIVIFLVRLHYYIHVWNGNLCIDKETKKLETAYTFDFVDFPRLEELFTDLESALGEKEVIISEEGNVARKKPRKKRDEIEVINECSEKVKALLKTSGKMGNLFKTFETQLSETEVALKDTKMAVANIKEKKDAATEVNEATIVNMLASIAGKGIITLNTPKKPDEPDDSEEEST